MVHDQAFLLLYSNSPSLRGYSLSTTWWRVVVDSCGSNRHQYTKMLARGVVRVILSAITKFNFLGFISHTQILRYGA